MKRAKITAILLAAKKRFAPLSRHLAEMKLSTWFHRWQRLQLIIRDKAAAVIRRQECRQFAVILWIKRQMKDADRAQHKTLSIQIKNG